jgi:hypothetical protein
MCGFATRNSVQKCTMVWHLQQTPVHTRLPSGGKGDTSITVCGSTLQLVKACEAQHVMWPQGLAPVVMTRRTPALRRLPPAWWTHTCTTSPCSTRPRPCHQPRYDGAVVLYRLGCTKMHVACFMSMHQVSTLLLLNRNKFLCIHQCIHTSEGKLYWFTISSVPCFVIHSTQLLHASLSACQPLFTTHPIISHPTPAVQWRCPPVLLHRVPWLPPG